MSTIVKGKLQPISRKATLLLAGALRRNTSVTVYVTIPVSKLHCLEVDLFVDAESVMLGTEVLPGICMVAIRRLPKHPGNLAVLRVYWKAHLQKKLGVSAA